MVELLFHIEFDDWKFIVGLDGAVAPQRPYLQIEAKGPCADSGVLKAWKSRKWFLSYHMTKSEIVQTAFKAVMTAVEHEARENFRYKGEAIFSPHYDVDALLVLCREGRKDTRK